MKDIYNGIKTLVEKLSKSSNSVRIRNIDSSSVVIINGKRITGTENEESITIGGDTVKLKGFENITIEVGGDVKGDIKTHSANVNITGNVDSDKITTYSGNIIIGGDVVSQNIESYSGNITSKSMSNVGSTKTFSGNINL